MKEKENAGEVGGRDPCHGAVEKAGEKGPVIKTRFPRAWLRKAPFRADHPRWEDSWRGLGSDGVHSGAPRSILRC